MTFATIISEAGGSPKSFPQASEIPVTLYDGKNRVLESAHYIEPLFAHYRREQANFFNHVELLENSPVEAINVRIDIDSVILYYKTPNAKVFLRRKPMDPIDYMD